MMENFHGPYICEPLAEVQPVHTVHVVHDLLFFKVRIRKADSDFICQMGRSQYQV